jgi:Flp pilus assembly pilin Flp
MRVLVTILGARLRADRRAATAIEYALLASLVAGAAMAGMIALGVSLDLLFANLAGQIAAVDPARCVEVGSSCRK